MARTDCANEHLDDMNQDALREQLQEFLARVRSETGIPGLGAAISVEGVRVQAAAGTLVAGGTEPLTQEAEFHLGCITKILGAVVVLDLAAKQQLDLSCPIGVYLPELASTVHGESVSLSHLLSHTSGYRGTNIFEKETRALDWNSFVAYLHEAPQDFAPGTVYNYEHTEAVVAGEILLRVTGKSCFELIDALLLAPLGVSLGRLNTQRATERQAGQHVPDARTQTIRRVSWQDIFGESQTDFADFWRASFSTSSIMLSDLLTVAEHLMGQRDLLGSNASILSPLALHQLQRPVIKLPPMVGGPLAELKPVSFGHGAALWRDGFYGIGGTTYGQCQGFRFDPSIGAAVAVGVNVMHPFLRDLVSGRICEALRGTRTSGPNECIREFELPELVGEYRGSGRNRVVASLEDGRLVCVIESGATGTKVLAELVADPDHGLRLSSRAPYLSLGFFREAGNVGLMVGANAYKRVRF